MSKGLSPTQRTLKALRDRGDVCDIAEYWNQYARRRRDLFHWIDIVALRTSGLVIVGIQCTSGTNVSARRTKIIEEYAESARAWLECQGRIEVWGWRKVGARGKRKLWEPRIETITLADVVTNAAQ